MKPKLLLHVCCAPCLIGTLPSLIDSYQVSVFFYNPNIHPKEEYEKRKKEVVKYCSMKDLEFIEGPYDIRRWFELIKRVPGYANGPEGGMRCMECFKMRLEKTAEKAVKLNFQFFSTTLTLGENKSSKIINQLGSEIADKYDIFFVEADYKKKGGYLFSVEESKRLGIYRQDYCGCVFSMRNKK